MSPINIHRDKSESNSYCRRETASRCFKEREAINHLRGMEVFQLTKDPALLLFFSLTSPPPLLLSPALNLIDIAWHYSRALISNYQQVEFQRDFSTSRERVTAVFRVTGRVSTRVEGLKVGRKPSTITWRGSPRGGGVQKVLGVQSIFLDHPGKLVHFTGKSRWSN